MVRKSKVEDEKAYKEYQKKHISCPKCGSTHRYTTHYPFNAPKVPDKNIAVCINCKYKGIIDDWI